MDSKHKMKKISVLIVALSLVTVIIAITSMAAKEGTVPEDPLVTGDDTAVAPPNAPPLPVDVWHEAESGWAGRSFLIENGVGQGRGYIYTPEFSGYAYGGMNYYVTIPRNGKYVIEGIVNASNVGSDSFFVTVYKHQSYFDENTNQWQDGYIAFDFGKEHGWGQEYNAQWRFERCYKTNPGFEYGKWSSCFVNHWNAYVNPQQEAIPLVYNLKAGEYMVKFDMREDGTMLDKFRFVNWGPIHTPIPTTIPIETPTPEILIQ